MEIDSNGGSIMNAFVEPLGEGGPRPVVAEDADRDEMSAVERMRAHVEALASGNELSAEQEVDSGMDSETDSLPTRRLLRKASDAELQVTSQSRVPFRTIH